MTAVRWFVRCLCDERRLQVSIALEARRAYLSFCLFSLLNVRSTLRDGNTPSCAQCPLRGRRTPELAEGVLHAITAESLAEASTEVCLLADGLASADALCLAPGHRETHVLHE